MNKIVMKDRFYSPIGRGFRHRFDLTTFRCIDCTIKGTGIFEKEYEEDVIRYELPKLYEYSFDAMKIIG